MSPWRKYNGVARWLALVCTPTPRLRCTGCRYAIDQVLGVQVVPPVVLRRLDLDSLRERLIRRSNTASSHLRDQVRAQISLLDDVVRVAPPHLQRQWRADGKRTLVGAASLMFDKPELGTVDLTYRVKGIDVIMKHRYGGMLDAPGSEYHMLYYLLHCAKKQHNVNLDWSTFRFVVRHHSVIAGAGAVLSY